MGELFFESQLAPNVSPGFTAVNWRGVYAGNSCG